MVSWVIECRKYAGKNRLETQETQERETLVDETEEEEKIEVPHFSYSTASRLSSRTANLIYALTYFVSPNAGLLVVHGTSATSSPGLFPQPWGRGWEPVDPQKKSQTSLFSSMQAGSGLNSSCSMNSKHLVLTMSFLGL